MKYGENLKMIRDYKFFLDAVAPRIYNLAPPLSRDATHRVLRILKLLLMKYSLHIVKEVILSLS